MIAFLMYWLVQTSLTITATSQTPYNSTCWYVGNCDACYFEEINEKTYCQQTKFKIELQCNSTNATNDSKLHKYFVPCSPQNEVSIFQSISFLVFEVAMLLGMLTFLILTRKQKIKISQQHLQNIAQQIQGNN